MGKLSFTFTHGYARGYIYPCVNVTEISNYLATEKYI